MVHKRTTMAKAVVLFCIATITACAGIAQADGGGWGGGQCGKHQRHSFRKFEQRLGLTDAQKLQTKAVFQAHRAVVKPIITNLRAEQDNLQALIHADTIDEAAIRAETAKIAGIQADLNVNRAKTDAQFRAILTPSQVVILKSLQQKRHKRGTAPAGTPAG
ncbi:MAG: Spy/CpxP family protein refolding chaperone [Geobacteraceae bacterium]|nr:Spy/CpxP family protein refolding chaperone [Geobacteraceae bacterium]